MEKATQDPVMKSVDKILKENGTTKEGEPVCDVKVEDEGTSIDKIKAEASETLGKGNDSADAKVILKFLKYLLQLWGQGLNSREESEKTSLKGKIESARYTQTREHMRPFSQRLKEENVPDDILKHLVLIVNYMLDRDYVKVEDVWAQMVKENSFQITTVTHDSNGSQIISYKRITHDETYEEFLMVFQRLMFQCRKFFPADPSRTMEYIDRFFPSEAKKAFIAKYLPSQ